MYGMDWFEQAKQLKEQGYTYKQIGEMLGKARQTVKNRFYEESKRNGHSKQNKLIKTIHGHDERKPEVYDYGEYYRIVSKTRSCEISKEKLKLLKQLYCEQKLTINQVCRTIDIPRSDFHLIKTAFWITKDDVPYLDEELLENDIDELVEESIQRRKQQYYIRLQQKEIDALKREVEQYRQQDYFLQKIHRLFSENEVKYERPMVPLRPKTQSGLMLEVPIVDLHLAKLAWEPETGENYDSKIAEQRFMDVIYDVVERARKYEFEQIVFPIGNDFFNFNDISGNTTKGTRQDNDSRWQKMFLLGRDLLIRAIDLLSQLAPVKVFQIPGNHDTQVSWYVVCNIHAWFRNDPNVTVDINPRPRKYVEFGKCLIGFTHGDKEGKRIFGNMQVEVPDAWGRTIYREWHLGHLHSEQVKEEHGVKVRNLSSVTGNDAWHCESGFVGALAVSQSFVWDKERGLREIWYSTVVR